MSLGLLALILSFLCAAILAEGALHPLLKRRPSDTAALAYSIAQATGGTARKISIRSADGVSLVAWWLSPQRPSGRAVVVCHGVADSAYGALGYALLFLKDGYSILAPESRGHGESHGFVTYGIREADDTVRWLAWMKSNGVTSAFGFGESLGGAILLQSLPRGADFRALVIESSYSSFEAVAVERVARVIPAFPASPAAKPCLVNTDKKSPSPGAGVAGRLLGSILVKEALLYTYLRYGVNLSGARPDAAIAHARIPILLIHGLADNETSPEHSKRLQQANPAFATLWLAPRAKHTGAYAADPAAFKEKVLRWFAQVR